MFIYVCCCPESYAVVSAMMHALLISSGVLVGSVPSANLRNTRCAVQIGASDKKALFI